MANTGAATGTDIFGGQTQSPTNLGNLGNQLIGGVGPQLALGNEQIGLTQQQLGLQNQNLAQTTAYNNAMAGNQQAGLLNQAQGLGIQQAALGQQSAQNVTQQGFTQQEQALQAGQFPEQQAEAALAYQNSLMQTQGSQAIGGTQNTVGGRQNISTLGQQYGFQQQDIARAQGLFGLGVQSEQSGYQYSQQQLQNAAQQLQLNAAANGLSQQQLSTMLGYQNQQAGVGAAQNIIGLYSQLGSQELGQISTAGSALSQMGFAGPGINTIAGTG